MRFERQARLDFWTTAKLRVSWNTELVGKISTHNRCSRVLPSNAPAAKVSKEFAPRSLFGGGDKDVRGRARRGPGLCAPSSVLSKGFDRHMGTQLLLWKNSSFRIYRILRSRVSATTDLRNLQNIIFWGVRGTRTSK